MLLTTTTTKHLEVTMSNNKQSSVYQLESDLKIWFAFVRISFPTEIENSINRAKAMHKEEIVKAWSNGYDEDDRATSSPLKYYNETFK